MVISHGSLSKVGIAVLGSLSVFFTISLLAQPSTPTAEPSGDFLRAWMLCGPFSAESSGEIASDSEHLRGFDNHFDPDIPIEPGRVLQLGTEQATWRLHTSDSDRIDFDAAVSTRDNVFVYAYCEVTANERQACALSFGSNDGARVWLNGREVLDVTHGRGLKPDHDVIPVILARGRNTILAKVEERGNKWEMACRLLPLDERLLRGLRLYEIGYGNGHTVSVRYRFPIDSSHSPVREVALQVMPRDNPDAIIWDGVRSSAREIPLDLDTTTYGEYTVRVRSEFEGGSVCTNDIPFSAGPRRNYTLFSEGNSDYVIALDQNASDSERWAAEELQHWIKEVSGVELPMVGLKEAAARPQIVVGFNDRARDLLGSSGHRPDDADESFTYRNVGPHLVIVGGRQRGTMYGVHTFLERELGCRWYTPTVSVTPKRSRYNFHYLQHTEKPGIRVRNDFYFEAFEPVWAARNKINGAMSTRRQPGEVEGYWSVHTFFPLMPPDEFFATHPEYYSLVDGERTWDHAQLCLTNPEVLKIITERIRQRMRDQPDYLIYSVSQNDWRRPCECNGCQAIALREESEAGPVVWFVNQVAERIESEFPDKFIGTLAYQYTRKPCKTIRPRHNVVIRLCSIECCFAHDFFGCERNRPFVEDLQGWAAIAPHLYIWDYVVNFSHYIMPYPNFAVLQPNLQTFRDHHAIGVMEQAAYQSRGGEFAELRAYVLGKLLWNPEADMEPILDDFMFGYYQRSGQFVRRYFDLLHDLVTPQTHIGLGLTPDDLIFTDEFVRESERLFDLAEAVADSEAVLRRVEMARLPLMYLKCKRLPLEANRDGTYARFTAIVDREGITHYAERGAPHRQEFDKEMGSAH